MHNIATTAAGLVQREATASIGRRERRYVDPMLSSDPGAARKRLASRGHPAKKLCAAGHGSWRAGTLSRGHGADAGEVALVQFAAAAQEVADHGQLGLATSAPPAAPTPYATAPPSRAAAAPTTRALVS